MCFLILLPDPDCDATSAYHALIFHKKWRLSKTLPKSTGATPLHSDSQELPSMRQASSYRHG